MSSEAQPNPGQVGGFLRSWLTEARLGGLPTPERSTLLRRFPEHQDLIHRLYDEIFGSGPVGPTPIGPAAKPFLTSVPTIAAINATTGLGAPRLSRPESPARASPWRSDPARVARAPSIWAPRRDDSPPREFEAGAEEGGPSARYQGIDRRRNDQGPSARTNAPTAPKAPHPSPMTLTPPSLSGSAGDAATGLYDADTETTSEQAQLAHPPEAETLRPPQVGWLDLEGPVESPSGNEAAVSPSCLLGFGPEPTVTVEPPVAPAPTPRKKTPDLQKARADEFLDPGFFGQSPPKAWFPYPTIPKDEVKATAPAEAVLPAPEELDVSALVADVISVQTPTPAPAAAPSPPREADSEITEELAFPMLFEAKTVEIPKTIEFMRPTVTEDDLPAVAHETSVVTEFPSPASDATVEIPRIPAEPLETPRRVIEEVVEDDVLEDVEVTRPTAESRAQDRAETAGPSTAEQPRIAPEPTGPRILRADPFGRLVKNPDATFSYIVSKQRLLGRGPAALFVERAERIAAARVDNVETARISEARNGDLELRWQTARGRALGGWPGSLEGPLHRTLRAVTQAAGRLSALHERGAAHGRIDESSIRIDPRTGLVQMAMGYETGPGLDGDDIFFQQDADVRSLSALLYRALGAADPNATISEILTLSQGRELPPLRARRPDLWPALVTAIDRGLRAGISSNTLSMPEFRDALRRVLEWRAPEPIHGKKRRVSKRMIWIAAALIAAAALGVVGPLLNSQSPSGRLAIQPDSDARLQHIRSLVLTGRLEKAREELKELGSELGIDLESLSPPSGR